MPPVFNVVKNMSQKITKEKLLDLYERSVNCLLLPEQCAIWLPEVCEYALELLREKESMEISNKDGSPAPHTNRTL